MKLCELGRAGVPYGGDRYLSSEPQPARLGARVSNIVKELHTHMAEISKELVDSGMRCNCDLDNWEPMRSTGHSQVCRIHKAAQTRALAERVKGRKRD